MDLNIVASLGDLENLPDWSSWYQEEVIEGSKTCPALRYESLTHEHLERLRSPSVTAGGETCGEEYREYASFFSGAPPCFIMVGQERICTFGECEFEETSHTSNAEATSQSIQSMLTLSSSVTVGATATATADLGSVDVEVSKSVAVAAGIEYADTRATGTEQSTETGTSSSVTGVLRGRTCQRQYLFVEGFTSGTRYQRGTCAASLR